MIILVEKIFLRKSLNRPTDSLTIHYRQSDFLVKIKSRKSQLQVLISVTGESVIYTLNEKQSTFI